MKILRHSERSESRLPRLTQTRNPDELRRATTVRAFLSTALLLLLLLIPAPAHPQGCSECRESIGQTPTRTQTAYRRAILLMVAASGTIFIAGVVVFRRFR